MTLVMDSDDPRNVEKNRKAGEQHAEGDEDCDGAAASGDVHSLVEV